MLKLILITFYFFCFDLQALEYSKFDFEGCPENSFCKKETGINRKKWLEQLKKFSKGEISEVKLNLFLQSEFGLPVSGWAREEASLLPNILMWDSPCKQHKNPVNKYYITEVFRKNFKSKDLLDSPHLIFSKAVMLDSDKKTYPITVPRGDAPLFIKDGSLFFLREDEGFFYGLLINREGNFKVIKNESLGLPPKEVTCNQEMVAEFFREAPSPNFYQGYFCKEIWDKTSKNYKTLLLGWSCN